MDGVYRQRDTEKKGERQRDTERHTRDTQRERVEANTEEIF